MLALLPPGSCEKFEQMFTFRGRMRYCCSIYFLQQDPFSLPSERDGTNLPDLLLPGGGEARDLGSHGVCRVRNRMWGAPNAHLALPSSFQN